MSRFDDPEDYALTYLPENLVLMHRDAHFGGSFDIMLDYYRNQGKGICPDIEFAQIEEMAATEKNTKENLAAILLSGSEAELVAQSRDIYKKLKKVCETANPKLPHPGLIAHLILSEDVHPDAEIAAIVKEKAAIVPALIEILKTEEYYNPLFPGYGHAPALAAECLGKIGDKRAIISLFEAIGEGDFFDEDVILHALTAIGSPAKEFLLRVLHARPLNADNDRAAIALVTFKDDPEVAEQCFSMLQDPEVMKHIPMATYLVLACEGLSDPKDQKRFRNMAVDETTPRLIRQDMQTIMTLWDKKV